MSKQPRKFRRDKANFELQKYVSNLELTACYLFLIIGGLLSILGIIFIVTQSTVAEETNLVHRSGGAIRDVVINGPFLLLLGLALLAYFYYSYRVNQKKKKGQV